MHNSAVCNLILGVVSLPTSRSCQPTDTAELVIAPAQVRSKLQTEAGEEQRRLRSELGAQAEEALQGQQQQWMQEQEQEQLATVGYPNLISLLRSKFLVMARFQDFMCKMYQSRRFVSR